MILSPEIQNECADYFIRKEQDYTSLALSLLAKHITYSQPECGSCGVLQYGDLSIAYNFDRELYDKMTGWVEEIENKLYFNSPDTMINIEDMV